MASLLDRLRELFRRQPDDRGWVTPDSDITRAVFAGRGSDLPERERPLAVPSMHDLDLAAFDEAPIPPLGVEPPLIEPRVRPDWAPADKPQVETPMVQRVAEQAPEEPKPAEEQRPRKRRWWRAA